MSVPNVVAEAELIALRRQAQYRLWGVLGGPEKWYHYQADRLLDRIDRINLMAAELTKMGETV